MTTKDQHSAPEGWKLVPTTPTDEMLVAMLSEGESAAHASCDDPRTASALLRMSGVLMRYAAMLSASPQPPAPQAEAKRGTSAQIQLERQLTCEAIDGAMAFGYQDTNPPPSDDHWLAPYWKIGRKQAEIEADRPQAEAAGAVKPGHIDLEGLRNKLLAPREIVRDEDGWLTHPAFPVCDEDVRADKFLEAFGIESAFVAMDGDADQTLVDRYFEDGDANCSDWTPTPPDGDGWVLLEIYDTEDGPYAMFARRKAGETNRQRRAREAEHQAAPATAAQGATLTVWYGSMPESNGKSNWTAILHRGDISEGITIDRSEYPDRVRYEADRMRWMIGEIDKKPWILDYDADKHSGYVAPTPVADSGARYIVIGYGETDHPQAAFVQTRDELLDAVLGMIYTHPSDACDETREEYRRDLVDDDEWSNEGIWRTEFEIGGVVIYDLGEPVLAAAPVSVAQWQIRTFDGAAWTEWANCSEQLVQRHKRKDGFEFRALAEIDRAAAPVSVDEQQTQAARDVLTERKRQVTAEGWMLEHDDEHAQGEMAAAATAYTQNARATMARPDNPYSMPPIVWPWSPAWWKPSTPRRDLVKAGALILAEIERIDRAATTNTGGAS